jgi:hypothetical protein
MQNWSLKPSDPLLEKFNPATGPNHTGPDTVGPPLIQGAEQRQTIARVLNRLVVTEEQLGLVELNQLCRTR